MVLDETKQSLTLAKSDGWAALPRLNLDFPKTTFVELDEIHFARSENKIHVQ